LRSRKIYGVNKKKKGRGKINQNGNDDPKLLGIIHIKDGRILDLLVKEEDAVDDQQAGLQAGGKGIETLRFSPRDVHDGDRIEQSRTYQQDDLEDLLFIGSVQEISE
jgi:hypothetical protein